MITMPGASYSGPLQPLSAQELQLAANLRRHVSAVASREHNMFKPDALEAAARYVQLSRARGDRTVAMFSLETIGYYSDERGSQRYPAPLNFFYPDTGNFIGFVANFASRALLRDALGAFRRHARFPSEGVAAPAFLPGVDWSDHASFWEVGVPALMITDTAPYRYPYYHSAGDTPDKVDYDRLARVVSGLQGMLLDLAEKQ